jgi:uncharacterized membrane protein YesL
MFNLQFLENVFNKFMKNFKYHFIQKNIHGYVFIYGFLKIEHKSKKNLHKHLQLTELKNLY